MADITLDQALPGVRNLAECRANAFVRRCRFGIRAYTEQNKHGRQRKAK